MHVHIASLGATKEPVLKGINAIPGIDKVYLLTSEKFSAVSDEVKTVCESMSIETNIVLVNAFRFQEITEAINRIYNDNYTKRTKFSINITGGTNLMAAAACSCATFFQWSNVNSAPVSDFPNLLEKSPHSFALKYCLFITTSLP